jgi:hypothetical protein
MLITQVTSVRKLSSTVVVAVRLFRRTKGWSGVETTVYDDLSFEKEARQFERGKGCRSVPEETHA